MVMLASILFLFVMVYFLVLFVMGVPLLRRRFPSPALVLVVRPLVGDMCTTLTLVKVADGLLYLVYPIVRMLCMVDAFPVSVELFPEDCVWERIHPRREASVIIRLELWRDKHIEFLTKGLKHLAPSFCVLDANRPWLCYWILHSLALLGDFVDSELEDNVVDFLCRCQGSEGGYGGGPGQLPHLATTYAAVNSLITLGNERALSSINRDKLRLFLLRMKDPSGAFRMHDGGEIDVRACYTAISVASSLHILDNELVENVGDYILSCQTYEGGIAGEPGSEAHGGYTFCGLATMLLIGEADKLDLPNLIDWVTFRQGVEGGFQGRTNKLVDGCYSFWQGGVLALVQRILSIVDEQVKLSIHEHGKETVESTCSTSSSHLSGGESDVDEHPCEAFESYSKNMEGQLSDIGFHFLKRESGWGPLFHSIALQQYILLCCQVLDGGFRDKPGKHRDFYHSCYCLSGLALCQYSWTKDAKSPPPTTTLLGPYFNLLEPVHPLYGVVLENYLKAHEFFHNSEHVRTRG